MKIYTKTGDLGTTSIIGERTEKDDLRVDAYGTIDTLNSNLNLVMSINNSYNESLQRISCYLFTVGHDIAQSNKHNIKVDESETEWLEEEIDRLSKSLKMFNHFVLPGGTQTASQLHICRCICRECERKVVKANKKYFINDKVLVYLNRLSDYLYTLACYENVVNNVELFEVKGTF